MINNTFLPALGIALMLALAAATVQAQDYDSLIRRAVSERNAGDMAAAEATLRQAWPIPADKSEVAYLLGMVVAFQDRFDEALDILDEALADHPDNQSLILGRARVLSFQGRYAQASEPVQRVLAQEPNNVEALNLAGRIAWYQMQHRRARDYFERALVIDSANLETLTGLFDVETALGNGDSAARYLAMAAAIAPDHIDVLSRQDPARYGTRPRHQVTVGYANSSFDLAGFPQWYERSLEYRHLGANGNQQYIRSEHNHRFGAHDTLVEAGALFNQAGALPLEVAVGYTGHADFMPEYLVRLGTRHVLWEASDNAGTTVLTAQAQQAGYNNGDVKRLLVGAEYYLQGVNAWLTPSLGMVRDQDGVDTFAWTLGGHWQVSGSTRIGASYSDAPETENLITTGTRNYQGYLRQALGPSLTLMLYYSRHERENSYTRENLNLSLQYQF